MGPDLIAVEEVGNQVPELMRHNLVNERLPVGCGELCVYPDPKL